MATKTLMRKAELSVVIPVMNEAANVRPLAAEIASVLGGRIPYELLFVDDGSTDGTAEVLAGLARDDAHVRVLAHTCNRGQSAAVRTGVKAARAAVIAVLDGDGQNDPKDIPALYGRLVSGKAVSMVIGERRRRNDSWLRRLSSRIANAVRSRVLKDGVRDTGCGLKVFYREAFLELPAFDHMHRFLPALLQRNGGRVCSVPVNHRARRHGESKYGIHNRLWVGITDLFGVMWLQRRRL